MEMKDLERLIDERSQKQIDDAKESIKKELGAVPQAQIDEAVKKAVAEVTAKADAEEQAGPVPDRMKESVRIHAEGIEKGGQQYKAACKQCVLGG